MASDVETSRGRILFHRADVRDRRAVSKHPERFGKETIEGVAGPEPQIMLWWLPIISRCYRFAFPPTVVMAVILGALAMQGIGPGPVFIKNKPDLLWGLVASMYLRDAMLRVFNLPLIGLWVRVLSIPYVIVFPLILLFCLIGVHSLNYNIWEIIILTLIGIILFTKIPRMPRSVNGDEWRFRIGFRKLPVFYEAVKPRLVGGDRSHGANFFTISALPGFKRKKFVESV